MKENEEFIDDDFEIQENRGWLPQWWMYLLYGTIAFSVVFVIYLHGIAGWSQEKQYQAEVAAYARKHPVSVVSLDKDGVNPYRGNAAAIAAGEKTFAGLCAACHKQDMTGLIGPNLVDATWLHGNTDRAAFQLIMEGVDATKTKQQPSKGPMPANKDSLGAKKVLEVMAYIASKNPSLKPK